MLGATAGSPYGKDMSADAILYEPIDGELHRHGARLTHAHPHAGPHVRDEPELHHDPGVAVVASAAVVAIGLPVADPLIGLAITAVILRITWQSWRTVRGGDHAH